MNSKRHQKGVLYTIIGLILLIVSAHFVIWACVALLGFIFVGKGLQLQGKRSMLSHLHDWLNEFNIL